MKPQLVIFDMDGLLIDTELVGLKVWQEYFKDFSEQEAFETYLQVVGINMAASCEYIERTFPTLDPVEFWAEMKRRTLVHYEAYGVPVKSGVNEILDTLEQLSIPKCLATSSSREDAMWVLHKSGLDKRFNGMLFGDMVINGKPDPEIFLKAAALFQVEPTNCLVLEDSIAGLSAAMAAGMKTIMVPDLIQPDAQLRSRLFGYCESLHEVIHYLH